MNDNEFDPQVLLDYILSPEEATGGIITIRSRKTGKDYSYKINKTLFLNKMYFWVYVEVGRLEFRKLGRYTNERIMTGQHIVYTPPAEGIAWILDKLLSGEIDKVREQTEFFHTGLCIACNRTLTDAVSIEIGMGSICRQKNKAR